MKVFYAANLLFRLLRDYFKILERRCFVWAKFRTTSKYPSHEFYVANLLLVKDPVYCSLATVCVSSFIHYHPKSQVVITVDSETRARAEDLFKREINLNRVKIQLAQNTSLTWQDQKLALILKVSGTNEFFIDADMRWNGTLPRIEGVTFFVDEFKFADKSPYAQITQIGKMAGFQHASMKNTSFVSWGNYKLSDKEKNLLSKIVKNLREVNESDLVPLQDKKIIARLSEQIALSCLAEKIDSRILFLKSKDGRLDGHFLESSYYGATGIQF